MSRIQSVITTVLGVLALGLVVACVVLASMNRELQKQIGARTQYMQQSAQLQTLYGEIVRALAELGARHNDDAVRAMLQRHGITYSVNAPAAASQPQSGQPRR